MDLGHYKANPRGLLKADLLKPRDKLQQSHKEEHKVGGDVDRGQRSTKLSRTLPKTT